MLSTVLKSKYDYASFEISTPIGKHREKEERWKGRRDEGEETEEKEETWTVRRKKKEGETERMGERAWELRWKP